MENVSTSMENTNVNATRVIKEMVMIVIFKISMLLSVFLALAFAHCTKSLMVPSVLKTTVVFQGLPKQYHSVMVHHVLVQKDMNSITSKSLVNSPTSLFHPLKCIVI